MPKKPTLVLGDRSTLYDLLELPPDCSPQEILESYLRLKSAFDKNSLALYSLVSKDETEDVLKQIEDAYQILSHPEKRKEYDRTFNLGPEERRFEPPVGVKNSRKIISIDRVPPMQADASAEELLEAPTTDFSNSPSQTRGQSLFSPPPLPAAEPSESEAEAELIQSPMAPPNIGELERAIESELEWKGEFIKRIRETRRISIDELSEFTRISKSYLKAIEDENYAHLPAAVFLRGFIVQVAKKLKIPHEKVANAYIARYRSQRPEKT
jgi:curved DNA-binding protein CbpA